MTTVWLDRNSSLLSQISRRIWEYAEPGLQEHQSSRELQQLLKNNGFRIETGFSGMETAFRATWGSGKPVIGFLGEFDALPDLNQDTVPEKSPIREGQYGHGCGHNLLGTSAAGAAVELKHRMESEGLKGTVVFWGCPDEEGTHGKVYMARDGLFHDLDVALTMHPGIANFVNEGIQAAYHQSVFEFFGVSAHAAAAPWDGRSALDALELMHVGLNYLREHVPKGVSMHYVTLNGGERENIVPAYASSRLIIRGETIGQVKDVFDRVVKIAEGACLMTETTHKHKVISAVYSFNVNETLAGIAHEAMEEAGATKWTTEELDFASRLQSRYGKISIEQSIINYVTKAGLPYLKNEVLHTGIIPYWGESYYTGGATDVNDVSWIVPSLEINTACRPVGLAAHTWEQTACAGMSIGQKGMLLAAKTMALTGYRLLKNPELLKKVQEEFHRQTNGEPYKPLID